MYYLLTHFLCLKVVRDIPQSAWFSLHCLLTYLICLRWYISQGFWFILNSFFTHPFGFETIRDSVQLLWIFFNSFFTHFLCLKMVRNIPQCVWFSVHCLFTYLFCFTDMPTLPILAVDSRFESFDLSPARFLKLCRNSRFFRYAH